MLGPLAALASSLTWAVGSSAYSPLSKKYSGLTVNLARASAAFPIFVVLITLAGKWGDFSVITSRETLWLVISIIASYGSGDALFMVSSQSLGVPGALAIASAYPIWSAIAGAVFLGQSLSWVKGAALVTVLAGVILVIVSDMRRASDIAHRRHRVFGVLMALATSLFWSLNTYANAKVRPEISSFVANSIRMGVGIFVCSTFILFTQKRGNRRYTVEKADWKKFGWIFGIEGAGGSFFFVYGLTHSSLAVASVLSALAPAMAVPIALFVRRENIPTGKVIGVLLAVVGVIWLVSV